MSFSCSLHTHTHTHTRAYTVTTTGVQGVTQVTRNAPDQRGPLRERGAAWWRSERERYWRRRSYRAGIFEEEEEKRT